MIGPFGMFPKGTVRSRMLPLARALHSLGMEVEIILPPYDNREDCGRVYRLDGIAVRNVKGLGEGLWTYIAMAIRASREAIRFRPSVVHVFKPKGPSGLAGMFLFHARTLQQCRFPIVIDTDDWEGPGGFNEILRNYRAQPAWLLRVVAIQERWLLRRADAVTVASRALETLVWAQGVQWDRVFYAPNGPSGEVTAASEETVREVARRLGVTGRPTVVLLTRYFEWDIEEVIAIFERVKQHVSDVRFVVIGRADFGEDVKFSRLLPPRGLTEAVRVVGWVDPKELPVYLRLGKVAMFPMKDCLVTRAKCPAKLVDLMAAERAIVASRVGQAMEYIDHGISGLLAEPGDVEGFAMQVVRLLEDPGLAERLGKEARVQLYRKFGWERVAESVVKAYEFALRARGS
jgi:glycosyltransferase involved in cell wall biosynthesis